jgi:hypothetical protein
MVWADDQKSEKKSLEKGKSTRMYSFFFWFNTWIGMVGCSYKSLYDASAIPLVGNFKGKKYSLIPFFRFILMHIFFEYALEPSIKMKKDPTRQQTHPNIK